MFEFLKRILNINIFENKKEIKNEDSIKNKNDKNSAGVKNRIIINGKKYNNISSGNFTISNNKIYINDSLIKNLNNIEEKNIKIEIYGDKNFISIDSCETVTVNGNVYNIKLTNGTITCNDVGNDVNITNGNINVNRVFGKCKVINGDIKCLN